MNVIRDLPLNLKQDKIVSMTIPLSLYIHFPWCIKKCPYCDFNSHPINQSLPEEEYIHTLIQDLEQALPTIWGRKITTIFMGGGTPSLFSVEAIDHLLQEINARLPLTPNLEITLEANPSTVEQKKFKAYRQIGINRLSLGIQSFLEDKLHSLGRVHDGKEAREAILIAKEAGFENFNLDLMFGLPEQTPDEALLDLEIALSFQPKHLSWYQLTIESNTYFAQFPPSLPPDDLIWKMQEQGQALLHAHGLSQYEISAYSEPHYQCLHNRNYWEYGDYLGIGAGAHSKITLFDTHQILRKRKIRHPKHYLHGKQFTDEEKIVTDQEKPLEFLLNALRLYEPIPKLLFQERTGLPLSAIEHQINIATQKGLLISTDNALITTELGKRFLNDLLQIFY